MGVYLYVSITPSVYITLSPSNFNPVVLIIIDGSEQSQFHCDLDNVFSLLLCLHLLQGTILEGKIFLFPWP